MTAAQRMASMRARRKAQGLVKVEVWVPKGEEWLVKMAAKLCNEAKAKDASDD